MPPRQSARNHPMQPNSSSSASSTAPISAARLSSLSTTTLSQILELTRAHQLSLPSPSLQQSISKNLTALKKGLDVLNDDNEGLQGRGGRGAGSVDDETLRGLETQYDRLCDLSEPLGVELERRTTRNQVAAKLVDTGEQVDDDDDDNVAQKQEMDPLRSGKTKRRIDEYDNDDDDDDDLIAYKDNKPDHTTINVKPAANLTTQRELDRLEQDEDTLNQANHQVMQMQRRIMDDQDETLDSLSSAIARQHSLSLHISSELEMQSNLLDDTDQALDRTDSSLRRANNQLDRFTRRAKQTGSTGLIVGLVILLVILIVLFKL
ncbi:hypothetical protein OIV83_004992 [Microbotryomycetes sp. JL201]|nr:hypothetical protein OIV83_004992 [Microbotryomycetes sp. JL201]